MAANLKIYVAAQFPKLATRPEGIGARNFVLDRLQENEKVEIDFSNVTMTPSFADEFIGRLAAILGEEEFARRVTLSNVPERVNSLLTLVITRRRTDPAIPA